MCLYGLLGPPLLKLYFDVPRKSPMNRCLRVCMNFKALFTCTHSFWANTSVHREMCMKTNIFGIFLIESRITWILAFHMPREHSDSTLHCLFEGYILILLDALKEENSKSKESIGDCCLTCLCLSLHPSVPLENTFFLFQILPFICKISIEMEDWSGGVPGGGLGLSCSHIDNTMKQIEPHGS